MQEKMEKSLVVQGGHSLVVHEHEPTWGQMEDIDEGFSVPDDFPEAPSQELSERFADALDTPEMYAQISPSSLRALERVIQDFNRTGRRD